VSPYSLGVIETFKHLGLRTLFETGASAKVAAALTKRIKIRLIALHAAQSLAHLNQPGFNFHPLKGKPQRYSIHVNGPWCITFEWNGAAQRVDLEQYH
jgi:toxin HigB-1